MAQLLQLTYLQLSTHEGLGICWQGDVVSFTTLHLTVKPKAQERQCLINAVL